MQRVEITPLQVGYCRHPEWIALRGGRFANVEFPSQCVLIRHPQRGAILYDTGYADPFLQATRAFPERLYRWITPVVIPDDQQLPAQLARHGLELEDIALVLISHLHADHVAGLRLLPRARFMAMRSEVEATLTWGRLRALRHAFLPALLPDDFFARLDYAEDARRVDLGAAWRPFAAGFDLLGDASLLAVSLPGHSLGQMGLVCRDVDGRDVLLAADACWSTRAWREQRPPAFLARALIDDWSAYGRTLAGLLTLATAQPDLAILPSHCAQAARDYCSRRVQHGARA